jgi:hypothetical protein
MATGMLAEPVSGIVGMAALPFGVDVAANAVRKTQQGLTYQPRTEAGQQGMQALQGFMQPISETVSRQTDIASKVLAGNAGFDVNTPGGQFLTGMLPALAASAPGFTAARAIPGRRLEMGDIGAGGVGSRQRGAVGGIRGGEPYTGVVDNIPSGSSYKGKVYHSTDKDFTEFDLNESADGTAWFVSDRNTFDVEGSAAQAATGRGKVIEADVELNKVAGWEEMDRYMIDQLIDMGYDGAVLDGDVQVFVPSAIKSIKPSGKTAKPATSQRFTEDNRLSNLNMSGAAWGRIRENNPTLKSAKSPNDKVTIYRATIGDEIRPDDFVAVNRDIAEMELESVIDRDGAGKIITQQVAIKDLLIGNDASEFVYFPSSQ